MPISFTGNNYFDNGSRYDNYKFSLHKNDEIPYNYYYLENEPHYLLPELNDKADIKAVYDIHKSIIEDGKLHSESLDERNEYNKRTTKNQFTIIYKLKDGTELTRYYERISNKNIEKLLKLEDSNAWNKYIDESLKNRELENTISVLFSKQMEKKTFIDEKLNADLLNAVSQDIKELSFENFWLSDEEYLGTIEIHDNYYFTNADTEDFKLQAQMDREIESVSAEDIIRREWKPDSEFEYFGLRYSRDAVIIPINSNMKNTVNFLKTNNLYDELFDDSPVVSARYTKAVYATSYIDEEYEQSAPVFIQFWEKGDAEPFKNNDIASSEYVAGGFMPKSAKTTTDQNVIDSLLNNAYGLYLDTQGESAYIVEFTRQNGEKTIMYVPSGRVNLE